VLVKLQPEFGLVIAEIPASLAGGLKAPIS
jgi:hypothetical protein